MRPMMAEGQACSSSTPSFVLQTENSADLGLFWPGDEGTRKAGGGLMSTGDESANPARSKKSNKKIILAKKLLVSFPTFCAVLRCIMLLNQ